MSDQERVCLHGSLRRQCESCDLAARLDAAEAEIAKLKAPPDHERLRAIAEREQQATKGPWGVRFDSDVTGYPCYFIKGVSGDDKRDVQTLAANARFLEGSRDDVPYLLSLVARQAQEIEELRTERDDLKGFTVSALAKHMGQGEMKYGSAWAWLVSRENLLRKVQAALQTRKSDAPTAEAAIDDRLALLKGRAEAAEKRFAKACDELLAMGSSRDALREALKQIQAHATAQISPGWESVDGIAAAALAETPTEDQR